MNIELHLHGGGVYDISIRSEDGTADRFEHLEAVLTQKAGELMVTTQELRDQVHLITEVIPALRSFLEGKNQQIDDLKAQIKALMDAGTAHQADIDAMFEEVKTDSLDINAILSGTPADPSGGGGGVPPVESESGTPPV